MNILGIETSCDETAAAVVVDGVEVMSNVVSSQIAKHAPYGGVVPELAAREHLRNITPVVEAALSEAGVTASEIDGVAATCRPGLVPALLVGLSYAKGIAAGGAVPLIGVNHFVGHMYSCFLEEPALLVDEDRYPLVVLVVSGGHTVLASIELDGSVRVVGQTLDDAAGEAFDKGAKILELGYPGGPPIEALAREGDPGSHDFPRGLTGGGGKLVSPENRFNFSFSGLKTALLYRCRDLARLTDSQRADLAASYQAAIVDVLGRKTFDAAEECEAGSVLLCGGVACNRPLRAVFRHLSDAKGIDLTVASPKYCTDNAVMIAGAGYHLFAAARFEDLETAVAARLPVDLPPLPFTPQAGTGSTAEALM